MADKMTTQRFEQEVLLAEEPVLIDFYADWCMPCKMLAPVIEEIASEATEVKVFKVNIDEEPELAQEFDIMSIPTLMVMKDGLVVDKVAGVRGKEDILNMLSLTRQG